MSRWLKITLISVAIIFGLLLSTMVIVPWQIKEQGSDWIAANTTRTLTIEKVYFNPFTLTVAISGTKLTEQNSDQPFVAFKRLMFSASPKSIIKQAIILNNVELDDLFVNLELLGKQDFNFSDFTQLGGNNPEPTTPEPKKPLYFSLNNIVLTGGRLDFTDQTSPKKSQHKIRELALSIPFIGNIPYLIDDYVEPLLYMELNGSEIHAEGKLRPFHNSLEARLSLSLDDIDLAYYAFHSPIPLPLDVKQGTLDGEMDLSYRISKTEKPRLLLGGKLVFSAIDLRGLEGGQLFSVPTLIFDLDWGDLFAQDFNLAAVDIHEPQLYVDRDSSGFWNFQRLMMPTETTAVVEEEVELEGEVAASILLLNIKKLLLTDGQVHYRDDFVPGGYVEEIRKINLELNDLSTHKYQKTAVTLKFQTDRNFSVAINGEMGIVPLTANLQLTADTLPLKPYYPYLEEMLTAPIEGILNLSGQIIYTENGNIKVQQARMELNDFLVPFSDKDQFSLSAFSINDSSFDLQQQDISLGAIRLSGGDIKATRLADGSFSPFRLLREQPRSAALQEVSEPNRPWTIGAESVDLQNFKFLLADLTLARKPQFKIHDFNFHVENLSYPTAEKSPFSLAAKVRKKGSITIDGTVVHTPLQLQSQTLIKSFPLAFLNNFVPEGLNIELESGNLYSALAVNLRQEKGELGGSFSGKLNISNFDLRDPIGDGEILVWDNLELDGIKGKLDPFSFHVKDIVLSDYLANIRVTTEGRVNLTSITATELKAAAKESNSKPSHSIETVTTEATVPADPEPLPDIRIGALTLQGGTVSFVDRHLSSIFSTTMYELGGRVTGLSSAEEMRADVDLRGQLESHSPLTITGKINPLSRNLFADLTLSFRDIDLTPLSPYSGTFLGYAISRGKLYLDLNYHIEDRKIKATNRVMIDQFTFGDSVSSDQATSLPVAFAIALLKDSNGEIHLDIPVSGDLNDPAFSVGSVIFTVLKNLVIKAATSPFSLLSSMLGGDEDFTGITFPEGLTKVDEAQLPKLTELAGMLANRPALILEISGFADQENDPEGYRQDRLRQMLVAAKWGKMAEDGDAPAAKEEVIVSVEEYPEMLLLVYEEAEFPRPKNFIGILKKLPTAEMEKLLLANIVVGEEQIQELAKGRAMAVRDALVVDNEEIKSRLFLKKVDIYQLPDEGPASRVEFNITSK